MTNTDRPTLAEVTTILGAGTEHVVLAGDDYDAGADVIELVGNQLSDAS